MLEHRPACRTEADEAPGMHSARSEEGAYSRYVTGERRSGCVPAASLPPGVKPVGALALAFLFFAGSGCEFSFPDNGIDGRDAGRGPRQIDATNTCVGSIDPPWSRDPETSECWEHALVEDPATGECVPRRVKVVDPSYCRDRCTDMDEKGCRATEGCRALYRTELVDVDCESPCERALAFIECRATDEPRNRLKGRPCEELDASQCAQLDYCIGIHQLASHCVSPPVGAGAFQACASEAGNCSGCGPMSLRNPKSGICETIQPCPAVDSFSGFPDWAICDWHCEDLDEESCIAEITCRAAYVDHGDGAACSPLEFVGCWGVASRVEEGAGCDQLDAYQCSRRPDCVAVHLPTYCPPNARCASPYADFLYCASEAYLKAANAANTFELRDPVSGLCRDCRKFAAVAGHKDVARCDGRCEELDEATCVMTPGCRAAYTTNFEHSPDPIASAIFVGCWSTAPSQPGTGSGGDCTALDALECSRRDNCAAYHEIGPPCDDWECGSDPNAECVDCPEYGLFRQCGPEEPPIPPECDTISDELECVESAGCMPLYRGSDCSCTDDGICSCNYWTFYGCTSAAVPPGDDPQDAAAIAACVEEFSGCDCEEGCVDGFFELVWYPASAGTYPSDTSAPEELLKIGVARYLCSVCTCQENWLIQKDGGWASVSAIEMCTEIVTYRKLIPLKEWVGGCC
ncbi:MAG: hypothetical protein V2A73_12125 [Pseudomonadota bacterium]